MSRDRTGTVSGTVPARNNVSSVSEHFLFQSRNISILFVLSETIATVTLSAPLPSRTYNAEQSTRCPSLDKQCSSNNWHNVSWHKVCCTWYSDDSKQQCTKCNSRPITGQFTNYCNTIHCSTVTTRCYDISITYTEKDMLVATYVHGNSSDFGPTVSLGLVLMVCSTCLQHRLVDAPTAGDDAWDHSQQQQK